MQLSFLRWFKPVKKLESDPELKDLWHKIRAEYFPFQKSLDDYTIIWSKRRQKRTLASCSINQRLVRVAQELNYPDLKNWLNPLIYHEMCHAALGQLPPNKHGKRAWHGAEFKNLEKRHPKIKELDYWIKTGGWSKAVRSDRTKKYHLKKTNVI